MTRVEHFDRHEYAQRLDRRPIDPRLFATMCDLLALQGTEQILDIGTGTGRVAARLLPMLPAGSIIGVDAAPAMLRQARAKRAEAPRYRLVLGTGERLPIRTAAADVALFTFVLHHLGDPLAALRNAREALKVGGRLVVIDPVLAEPADDLDLALHAALDRLFRRSHGPQFRLLTVPQAARLVEEAGFVVDAVHEIVLTFEREPLDSISKGWHFYEAFSALAEDVTLRQRFEARYLRFDGNPPRATGRLSYAAIRAALSPRLERS